MAQVAEAGAMSPASHELRKALHKRRLALLLEICAYDLLVEKVESMPHLHSLIAAQAKAIIVKARRC